MSPFGPRLKDVAWVPFVIIGVLITLLLLFATLPDMRHWRRPRTRREAIEQVERLREGEILVVSAFGYMFWVLFAILIIALVSRYTFYLRPVLPPPTSSLEYNKRVTVCPADSFVTAQHCAEMRRRVRPKEAARSLPDLESTKPAQEAAVPCAATAAITVGVKSGKRAGRPESVAEMRVQISTRSGLKLLPPAERVPERLMDAV